MLYLLLFEREREREREREKREKKREKQPGGFFLGHTCPIGSARPGFFWLLGTIKNCFKGQSLNFMCT
jgi:hypothetical protein